MKISKSIKTFYYILIPFSILLSLCIAEGLSRKLGYGADFYNPSRIFLYRFDALLGWHPIENVNGIGGAKRSITIRNNSKGFRDVEHTKKTKPRLLFLGDSFVWGFDVEEEERFTNLIQTELPLWEVINVGVAGYGTDQELLLLQSIYDEYKPDSVFLLFCNENDRKDNSSSTRNGGYHKPYFVKEDGLLKLRGTPVPESLNTLFLKYPLLIKSQLASGIINHLALKSSGIQIEDPTFDIISALKEFLESKKIRLFIGLTNESRDLPLEAFLTQKKITYLDLSTNHRFSEPGKHWNAQGHKNAANKILSDLHF